MKDAHNSIIVSDIPASSKAALEDIIIRPARLFEGYRIGFIAARTYFDTPLTRFLSPFKSEYYSHYERGFQHRAQGRLLEASNLTFVACEKSNPHLAIGYAQFARWGNDEGYKAQMKRRDTYLLRFLSFTFYYWCKFIVFLNGGDKSADPKALTTFLYYGDIDEEKHWKHRPNRWEARSVVVLEEFQGRGIGKMLMRKVIQKAEEEKVVVGLHASEPGKWMYQSVGFELLDKFQFAVDGEEGGGIMLYTPKILQAKED